MAIITISRGSLSGGQELAERVAARLKLDCLSREILVKAARDFGIDESELVEAVGKPPSFWERATHSRQLYLKYIRAVLLKRACSGRLVYHGHAGHFLLKDLPCVLRVRLIAPLERRLQAAMISQQMNQDQALQYVQKVDKDRARWTKFLYNVEWDDPALFDVTIHLEKMSMDTATNLVCDLATSPEYTVGPAYLAGLEGMALAAHVEAALEANPETRGVHVQVTAEKELVRLAGNIEMERLRPAILAAVRGVEGVRDVVDEMVVGKLSHYPT